jgi:hypothetical protein
MKHISTLILVLFISLQTFAQSYDLRERLDPGIESFVGLQYIPCPVSAAITDISGRKVFRKDIGWRDKGLQFDYFEGLQMPNGTYSISLVEDNRVVSINIIKY